MICKRCNKFFLKIPHNMYATFSGCPECNIKKSSGENIIKEWLISKNIKFTRSYAFEDCFNIHPLRFDFYLHDYNILVEYDGIQHFQSIDYFGGQNGFETIINKKTFRVPFIINYPFSYFITLNWIRINNF